MWYTELGTVKEAERVDAGRLDRAAPLCRLTMLAMHHSNSRQKAMRWRCICHDIGRVWDTGAERRDDLNHGVWTFDIVLVYIESESE